MAAVISVLPEFKGFAAEYDPNSNPFFEAICVDNLRKIKTVELGKQLLAGIENATPQSRSTFPLGVNVILRPLLNGMQYNQSGLKPLKNWGATGAPFKLAGMVKSEHPGHNLTRKQENGAVVDCPFWKDGTSANEAVDKSATINKKGTVCHVTFSNAQFMTSKGESCVSFIVLAHELIHSLHCLQGVHAGDQEELLTSGEGVYSDEPMSEAAFRNAFGMKKRSAYF